MNWLWLAWIIRNHTTTHLDMYPSLYPPLISYDGGNNYGNFYPRYILDCDFAIKSLPNNTGPPETITADITSTLR